MHGTGALGRRPPMGLVAGPFALVAVLVIAGDAFVGHEPSLAMVAVAILGGVAASVAVTWRYVRAGPAKAGYAGAAPSATAGSARPKASDATPSGKVARGRMVTHVPIGARSGPVGSSPTPIKEPGHSGTVLSTSERCMNCGEALAHDANDCADCGHPTMHPCKRCRTPVRLSWRNCPECGTTF